MTADRSASPNDTPPDPTRRRSPPRPDTPTLTVVPWRDELVERVGHDAVRVYYDIGNSTSNGYDVPAEIRMLGDRICQFHFKDGGHYLGEGNVAMKPVAEAMNAIGYKGWVVLETSVPSKDRDADFRKNANFVRGLLGAA